MPDSQELHSGPIVDPTPARLPERITLSGRLVSIVPIDPEMHGAVLYRATSGPQGEHLWQYLQNGPFQSEDQFTEFLRRKAGSADSVLFAIVDNRSRQAMGYAAYMRIEPAHRVIEIGSILYTSALQRSAAATEAMYLMARHAFEDLGYRRYEWKCNALNAASRRAALRLGFTFEGIFRQHMIVKGRTRDTAWYSMLDSEWPERRNALESWLDPSNFEADGRQRKSLAEFRR